MAIEATILSQSMGRAFPHSILVSYREDGGVPAATGATQLISLQVPRMYTAAVGSSTQLLSRIIRPVRLSVACGSSNFDARILSKDDIGALDTIYEEYRRDGIERGFTDVDFGDFTVRNKDDEATDKLYLYVNNAGNTHTGSIYVDFGYYAL